jgi:hypothetical protein
MSITVTFTEAEVELLRSSLSNEERRLRTIAHQESLHFAPRPDLISRWEEQAADVCALRLRIPYLLRIPYPCDPAIETVKS